MAFHSGVASTRRQEHILSTHLHSGGFLHGKTLQISRYSAQCKLKRLPSLFKSRLTWQCYRGEIIKILLTDTTASWIFRITVAPSFDPWYVNSILVCPCGTPNDEHIDKMSRNSMIEITGKCVVSLSLRIEWLEYSL